jgi:hypothetical protein
MLKKSKLGLPWLLAFCLMAWSTVRATTFLEWQSTYLGNGWFQYQMTVMNDPFFTEADITWVGINFTNQIDQSGDSTNWSYAGRNEPFSGWSFTNGIPARPYTETFLVRSSETSYRLASGTNNADGALILMSLNLAGYYPGASNAVYSQNIVGYGELPCLVPCRPEDADGSPTNFVYDLKLVPDIQINQLVQGIGGVDGVDFTWDAASTLLLQGTADFQHWTNISYIWSTPPETVWTNNTLLSNYGQYYRLELVADGHQSNLPPLSNAVAATRAVTKISNPTARVSGCQFLNGKLAVSITTQPGRMVQVQSVLSNGSWATVAFDVASLPNPAFFQAVLVP